jgi:hypothetical protein
MRPAFGWRLGQETIAEQVLQFSAELKTHAELR